MPQGNVASSRRMWDRFLAGDAEGTLAFLDPDVEVHEPAGMPGASVYRGHAGWIDQIERFGEAFTSLSYRLVESIDCGEDVVSVVEAHGTATSSGISGSTTYAQRETWREGRIVKLRYFMSKEDALEASGAPE